MPLSGEIVGVILAGGRSSRMGQNKALLDYGGIPLLEHMIHLVKKAGIKRVLISGLVQGYECIPDDTPFEGPAKAILTVLHTVKDSGGFLFVPIDMPLLEPEILKFLMIQKGGGYYRGWPLPVYLAPPYQKSNESSVRGLLEDFHINPMDLPNLYLPTMANINTPPEWKKVMNKREC